MTLDSASGVKNDPFWVKFWPCSFYYEGFYVVLDQLPTMHDALRGNYTPNQKLACFVHYFQIINTFLKNNICIIYYSKFSEELKNSIKI